jgi:hypothetical protein
MTKYLTIPAEVEPSDYDEINWNDLTQADLLAISFRFRRYRLSALYKLHFTRHESLQDLLRDIGDLLDNPSEWLERHDLECLAAMRQYLLEEGDL